MEKQKTKSMKTKLLLLISGCVLLLSVVWMAVIMFSISDIQSRSSSIAANSLLEEVKRGIENNTQAIVENARAQYDKEKGTLPDDVLIAKILDNIRNTQYSDTGYYFVYTYQGIRLVAPETRRRKGKTCGI